MGPAPSRRRRVSLVLLMAPLVLSAYTHLWNPVGFPDVFFDEGIYMRRAVHVLDTGNPQEAYFYDHPFFGQIVLSGALWIAGYPASPGAPTDPASLESHYMAPRVFMGLLAVLDTFLVYRISEKRFGQRTAFLAALLFAVMPMSWLFRRILLDSIFLPFALSSILLALYAQDSDRRGALLVSSGACLGLAIFTKVPAFTLIPLVLFVVYSSGRRARDAVLWVAPVLLIPLAWPAYAAWAGQFDLWIGDVLWQAAGRESAGLVGLAAYLLEIDPVMLLLGAGGFVYAAVRRNVFVLLWFAPMLLFFATVGYVQYFHWIPLIPVICIAAALAIGKCADRVGGAAMRNYAAAGAACAIAVFGVVVTGTLISSDVSSPQFESLSFVLENFSDSGATILASPVYSWILYYVYDVENVLPDYSLILFEPVRTEDMLLVADQHFKLDMPRGQELSDAYDDTATVREFGHAEGAYTSTHPYGSYTFTEEGKLIQVRASWAQPGGPP